MMYTSGSTGVPKGVVVTHAGLVNLFRSHQPVLMAQAVARAGGRRLRVAQAASFAFDSSWGPLLWLLDGHELVLVEDYRDPVATLVAIREASIDVLDVTPTYLAELEALGLLSEGRDPVVLVVGGEPTPPGLWERLAALDGTLVRNMYGPTEATVDAFGWSPEGPAPVANTSVLVLDDWLQPAPPGVPGELYVGGAGVARGYLGRPALTAERFVADPFGLPGARLYRTGDRARWRRDGVLELLGRTDDQVKVRGFRIEPGEVEAVLAAHPAVSAAAVIVREDRPGDRRLVAYVTPVTGLDPPVPAALDPAELRAWVAERLPSYLVPAAVVVLPALPLTANNKLDRRALPAPEWTVGAGRPPSGVAEETLAILFAELLDLPPQTIGADDDFFALGGHSLLAARLVARARALLAVDIPLRAVFDTPTVTGLAAALGEPDVSELGPVRRCGASTRRPTGGGRCPPPRPACGSSTAWKVPPPPTTCRSPCRWRNRSTWPRWKPRWPTSSSGTRPSVPFSRTTTECRIRWCSPPARCRWRSSTATPMRSTGISTSWRSTASSSTANRRCGPRSCAVGTEAVLSLVVHHIAIDEASDGAAARRPGGGVRRAARGREPAWAPPPVSYRDYALWQREWLGDPADPASPAGRLTGWWREALEGIPEELPLPTGRPRPPVPSFDGGTIAFDVPADLAGRVGSAGPGDGHDAVHGAPRRGGGAAGPLRGGHRHPAGCAGGRP